ncbi:MAG: ATP-binding protein [Chlamydiae bacterium]|nr:ATP-binding protein [Chlamydiota bacterium]MBI3277323.1 ATP-binding protein [Chlamydiota bacterium]
MDKPFLKSVIVDQRKLMEDTFGTQKIIEREGLEEARGGLRHPNILLISGLRRAGKSFFSHALVGGGRYGFINFDDERLIGFESSDFNRVLEMFYELYGDLKFLLFDEIQNVSGWELFINRLRPKYRIIVTGSNAHLLSSELATHLTGRFLTRTVFPLSFKEFLSLNGFVPGPDSSYSTREKGTIASFFSQYLNQGGIFEFYKFGNEFLRNLFSSLITKDIVFRHQIKYSAILQEFALLLINYFTNKLSLNKIAKSLDLKSSHTVKEYLKYLEDTFLIFTVNKFSYKVKEQFATLKKVYVVDNGFISALSHKFTEDRGSLLENLVAIELKRRGALERFELLYWDDYRRECDFILKRSRKIFAAFQVCSGLNLKNEERKVEGLTGALEAFGLKEGLILTESEEGEMTRGHFKIKIIPVWKWLLGL